MNTYLLILNKETLITIHYIFFIILGYVLGSIMFGYLIPKIFKQVDTKKDSEDGNPGTANAFIQGGMLCGICTLLLELGKGFVPVYLAKNTISPNHILFSFIMLAPVSYRLPKYQVPEVWKSPKGPLWFFSSSSFSSYSVSNSQRSALHIL